MPKLTEYTMAKRCMNCGSINTPDNKSCDDCGLLFVGLVSYDKFELKFGK